MNAEQRSFSPEIKISSSQILPSTHQISRPVSSSGSTLIPPMQNIYYENREQNVSPRVLNRRLSDSQSGPQMHPAIQRNSIEPSFQNLTSPIFQQRQPYCNTRFVSSNYQVDPNLHASYASSDLQMNSSSQVIPRFIEPSTQRLGMVQAGLVFPDRGGNISLYKSLDVSQSRAIPRYFDPPVATDRYRQQTTETRLSSLQNRPKNGNEMPSGSNVFRTTPVIAERSFSATPSLNPPLTPSKYLLQSHLNYSPRTEYSEKFEVPLCSFKTSEEVTKRPESFTPKLLHSARASRLGIKQALAEVDEGKATTMTIENELDKYIEKIRKLHHDLDAESLEEIDHEQNTSGDILNVSISDDDAKVPVDKSREKIPKEVEKVLALADDLASRTVDLNDAKAPEKEGKDENRSLESMQARRSRRPISEGSPASVSGNHEGRAAYAEDRISGDTALQRTELDSQNIEQARKENSTGFGNTTEHRGQQLYPTEDEQIASVVPDTIEEDVKDVLLENIWREYYEDIHVAEESLEQSMFDVTEELEPWSLDRVKKRIREVELTDIEEESGENESVVESESKEGSGEGTEHPEEVGVAEGEDNVDLLNAEDRLQPGTERLEAEDDMMEKNETEASEMSISQCQESEQDQNQADNEVMQRNADTVTAVGQALDDQKDDSQKEECNEAPASDANRSNQEEIATQGQEYGDQDYVDRNQVQKYADNEAEYVASNEEYNYDQNALYENDQAQEYQDYGNQEYVEGSTEQYEGYTGEQYDQYANVSEGQYEQDPNAQYPEDMNQQYDLAYDQQYDPNQVYDADVNQPYEYAETYDPNQTEVTQQQVDQVDQVEQEEDNREMLEETENRETEETVEKLETDRSKDDKVPSEDEPKKKKDVIKSLLDSDTDSTIERNVSNTESDFDFN